uniref:Uncharacterized protein n=1 Tax=Candidatus Kentrum sp. SD TaxID=2126332 RepID=A0A451BND7_9GAMM|nr:MAG: hypothetical protein BECKSD772D_GA0070982_106310 [Candidatus Kentron sp. SD]
MINSETAGFSASKFCLGVKALDDTAGKPSPGPKPIEQEGAVFPGHPSGSLQWFYSACNTGLSFCLQSFRNRGFGHRFGIGKVIVFMFGIQFSCFARNAYTNQKFEP